MKNPLSPLQLKQNKFTRNPGLGSFLLVLVGVLVVASIAFSPLPGGSLSDYLSLQTAYAEGDGGGDGGGGGGGGGDGGGSGDGTGGFGVGDGSYFEVAFVAYPSIVTLSATSASGAPINYTLPTAVQYVAGGFYAYVPVTCAPSSGVVPLGSSTVYCYANDIFTGDTHTFNFTVSVVDRTAPVITLSGINPMTVFVGSTYVEPGATAIDAISGNRPVTITGSVNTSVVSTSTITYRATDVAGNTATKTRTVKVVVPPDTIAPVITLIGANPMTIMRGSVYVESGATALDAVSGVTTVSISGSVNTSVVGSYTITYTSSDAIGNVATLTRTVNVIADTTAPVVTLNGVTPMTVSFGSSFSDPGATAIDAIDGARSVSVSGVVNTAVTGTYVLVYTASDNSGNVASLSRTVIVSPAPTPPPDTTPPSITLNGVNPVSVTVGGVYTEAGATANDAVNGPRPVSISGVVNTGVVGSYTVTYSSSDLSGNSSSITRTVNVVALPDTTSPSTPTLSSTLPTGVIVSTSTITVSWTPATDAGSGVAGYSFVVDTFPSTVPNSTVDTVSTLATVPVSPGQTYYFHLVSVDSAGNISGVVHLGPFVISDSQVLISNSTVNGVPYTSFSPSVASSTAFGVTGNSLVTNSTLSSSTVASSTIATSTITGSTITLSTILNSTISSSTVTNSVIASSTLSSGTSVSSSTLTNVVTSGVNTIVNSTLASTTLSNATIINGIMTSGTITLPNGTVVVVSTPTPLTSLINSAPVASFVAVPLGNLQMSFTDNSSDPNEGGLFPDSWNYSWNFGDGFSNSGVFATTSNDQTHTYASAGTYTVILSITDQYNLIGTSSQQITVSAGPLPTFDIFATSTGNGTISPVGTTTISQGGNQAYTITPAVNNSLTTLLIDGASVATTTSFTFSNIQTNHSINATFSSNPVPTFDIFSFTSGGGSGSITPVGTTTVLQGTNQTFNITPSATSTYSSLIVDGSSIATTTIYTFNNVSLGHTIEAVFNAIPLPTFNIVSTVSGPGVIAPLGTTTVTQGGNQTFNLNPNASSTLISLLVDGVSVSTSSNSYTFTAVNVNHTIDATFATATTPTFTIVSSLSGLGSGSITPLGTTTLAQNSNQTFTITPGATSTFDALTVDGVPIATSTSYTFTAINSNHTINANFGLGSTSTPTFNIFSFVSGPGTIAPLGTTTLAQGSNQTFNLTPNASSTLASLVVDGVPVATTTSFTFNNLQSGHNILAVFTALPGPDVTPPVITILGLNPLSIPVGTVFSDPGATASDNVNGNITANIVVNSTVATGTPGTYSVVYSVSDASGNTASSTRVVRVLSAPDVTPPVITIIGSNPATTTQGSTYLDFGATAIDNIDGNITGNITTVNPVNISVLGAYNVVYSVSDSSGNVASSTRVVNVVAPPLVDTTPPSTPVITSVVTIATTTLSSTLRAIWTDSVDNSGSLSGYSFLWNTQPTTTPDSIVETSATTTQTTLANGTWYFHVIAVDPSLNVSGAVHFGPITFNNLPAGDTTIPVGPTLVTSTTHPIGTTSPVTLVSLSWDTATDNVSLAGYSYLWDSNASSSPDQTTETSATSLNANLPNGTWFFHIRSVDSAGNVSTPVVDYGPITIATTTSDVTPPVGPTFATSSTHSTSTPSVNQSVTVNWDTATDDTTLAGYSYLWDNASSTNPDSVTDSVTTSFTATLPNGTWFFHIKSVDQASNASTPTVHFGPIIINTNLPADTIPPTAPVATISTSTPTTLIANWSISTDNSGMLAGYSFLWDTLSSTTPDTIVETSGTSTQATFSDGNWFFHVVAVDPSLNISTPGHAGPVIVDTTAPTITLVGSSTVSILVGTIYADAGATALDAIYGNLTASIVSTSTVNTSAPGTYSVIYTLSDPSGNTATPVSRTVNVLATPDTTPPVITIIGSNPATVTQGGSYTDLGATASDNIDGNITANIVTNNPVNTSLVGVYNVVYSVTDSSANTASSTRVVNVVPPTSFSIFASSTGQGTITPVATTTISQGGNQTYTITPNLGHNIAALTVDSLPVATTTSFTFTNVQANRTILATFAPNPGAPTFNIVATSSAGGTISPVGTTTVSQGNNQTITITPNIGFFASALTVDSVPVATTTSFTFTNVQAGHTINATFSSNPIPTFDIVSSISGTGGGTISPLGTTTVNQGNNQTFTITPNATSTFDALTVDSVPVATTTSFTFTNVQTTHTINAMFNVIGGSDLIPPSTPTPSSTTHVVSQISPLTNATFIWTNSTDTGGSGLSGYSFLIDTLSTTTPDNIVETTSTTTNQTLPVGGSYFFHIIALDNAGNASTVTHLGPFIISDSQVVIINSNIGGTFYSFFAPSLASSTALGITGVSNITNSTTTAPWSIFGSNLFGTTISSSTISSTNATSSTIINSQLTNCTVLNSLVKNYHASNCSVANSTVDPHQGFNDLTGTTVTGNSQIYFSDVTFSIINSSYIATSTIWNSTLTNSTSTNSTIATSTINGSTISNSNVSNATVNNSNVSNNSVVSGGALTNTTLSNSTSTGSSITGGSVTGSTVTGSSLTSSTVTNSTITNSTTTNATIITSTLNNVIVSGASSTIMNSVLSNTTVTDALIVNGIMLSGIITLPSGATTTISTSTPLVNIVNYTPSALFSASPSNLTVTFTDASTDLNTSGTLGDSWTYVWNFGDGTFATTTGNTLGRNQTRTYGVSGTYNVSLIVTDSFGQTGTFTLPVTVSSPAPAPSGGGGGGGGGGTITGFITQYGVGIGSGVSPIGTSTSPSAILPGTILPVVPQTNPVANADAFKFLNLLKLGTRIIDVTELQKRLTKEGFYSGPITGYYGPLTEGAVIRYQDAKTISKTGIVGPITRASLNGEILPDANIIPPTFAETLVGGSKTIAKTPKVTSTNTPQFQSTQVAAVSLTNMEEKSFWSKVKDFVVGVYKKVIK